MSLAVPVWSVLALLVGAIVTVVVFRRVARGPRRRNWLVGTWALAGAIFVLGVVVTSLEDSDEEVVLGAWWGELGQPGDHVLVFPGSARGGHLDRTTVTTRVLYPALEAAGIAREGESGRPRTFHSLRHTFARRALEGGALITWVKEQLGHSSITLTVDTYGHWETEARKTEAARLAEAFSG